MADNFMRVCCIGAGMVGALTGLALAEHNQNSIISIVDTDPLLINSWNTWNNQQPHLPFQMEGLQNLIQACDPRFEFAHATMQMEGNQDEFNYLKVVINAADVIFICVDIPTKGKGARQKFGFETWEWERAWQLVVSCDITNKTIVDRCTLPFHCDLDIFRMVAYSGIHYNLIYSPEFFSQEIAVANTEHPTKVILCPMHTGHAFGYNNFIHMYHWVPPPLIHTIPNCQTVVAIKLGGNLMLGAKLSSMNTLVEICEKVGADIRDVTRLIGTDTAGLGFGENTFYVLFDLLC